jgi:hypothetical protein
MTIPGFAAEASLYKTSEHYAMASTPLVLTTHTSGQAIVGQQVQPSPSRCGSWAQCCRYTHHPYCCDMWFDYCLGIP